MTREEMQNRIEELNEYIEYVRDVMGEHGGYVGYGEIANAEAEIRELKDDLYYGRYEDICEDY